ncbi:cation:dicarboxylate symporter family transporter [Anaplasma platys]|nr:cation:dicarboxylase symporter family transporter [Anaplasma platys]
MKTKILHTTKFIFLIAMVVAAFCFADLFPYSVRSFSYGVSLAIKEVLVFILPLIVFSIVFQSVSKLQGTNALKVILSLIALIMLSNSASMTTAHFVGKFATSHMSGSLQVSESAKTGGLEPYFSFSLPSHISCLKAVLLGFLCGMVLPYVTKGRSFAIANIMGKYSIFILEKMFAPILPIFIAGLVFRMQSENLVGILQGNSEVALYFFFSALLHIILLYIIAAGFSLRDAFDKFKSMVPTALFAFTTMSSLISMPLILKTVKKNSGNNDLADIIVPTSLNVHLVGDCFLMIIMSLVISISFHGVGFISTADYATFLFYFLLTKFAVVSIPGGGILVMLPIFEQYLHYSPAMLSLITTLYVILDPITTFLNVLGNGAFSLLFSRIYDRTIARTKNAPDAKKISARNGPN